MDPYLIGKVLHWNFKDFSKGFVRSLKVLSLLKHLLSGRETLCYRVLHQGTTEEPLKVQNFLSMYIDLPIY